MREKLYLCYCLQTLCTMRPLVILLLLPFVLLVSCNKDEDEKPDVYTGVVNEEMYQQVLNPPLQLQMYLDTSSHYYFGADSLDLDGNGSTDLKLVTSYGEQAALRSPGQLYDHFTLHLSNGFELATNLEKYGVGLGQTATATWVDTLSYNKKINDRPSWSESTNMIAMWAVPPDYVVFWGSDGPWYALTNQTKFIAIRKKSGSEYKYGWVEIIENSRYDLRVNAFAVEN